MIENRNDIHHEDLYQFFSSLVPQFKSVETIQFDLKHHLKIELDDAKKIYNDVYRILIPSHGQENNQFGLVTSFDNPSYKVHTNMFNHPSVYKFLFCTEDQFFIDKWLTYYKDQIGDHLYSCLTDELQKCYCEKNKIVDHYSKRVKIANILNSVNENLISFYDYCRWYYLTSLVNSYGCTPMFYDSSSGRLYFTMTIKKNVIREQILEGIKFHTGSCKSISLFIQTGYGTAIISKDSHASQRTIETNFVNTIPNFIESVIYNILKSGKRMSSLDNIILKSYNSLLFVEDYCKKSDDGTEMELPIKNNIWQRMEAKVLRNYSKDKANVTSLVSEYNNSLINPITQAIWS